MSRSKIKSILVIFFDCSGVVHHEFVPQNQTVNQTLYNEIFGTLCEKIRKTLPNLWPDKWFLRHGNALCHSSIVVREFLTKNKVTTLEHAPYSPDLEPCDFFLFPKIKIHLKENDLRT
jgi:histone-lysine N-methyltransferase SETMAR